VPLPLVRRPLGHSLLGAALVLASGAAVLAPTDVDPRVRAVASYDAAVPAVPGVRVLDDLESVRALVVEATPAGLARLARAQGVRGVSPDAALTLTGGEPDEAGGVFAADGLGGQAGRAGAGAGVRVAVLDTGVDDTPSLNRASGRLVDAHDWAGAAGPLDDGYGHGTFMASVIAGGPAAGSDGRPVGVAPAATVLVVRVADEQGRTSLSQVLGGLDWVTEHAEQVDVANLSFSYVRPGDGYGADPLVDAVGHAREAGVVVVVSAGNDPDVVGDPGFAPQALTAGAADLTGRTAGVASFSGSDTVAGVAKPDLVASGVSVLGVLPPDSGVAALHPTAYERGALWRGSGTSQAAAVTSGAAALLLAKRPDATPRQVKAALRAAAKPLPGDRDGAGLLRLSNAQPRSGGAGEPPLGPGSDDGTGEGGFDANSWSANSWSANSWSANSWSANSWSANSWSANSWSAAWGDVR
jgi:serine protease AprX